MKARTKLRKDGKSIRNVKTYTGKIPDNVGFCAPGGGGVIRHLTKKELKQQRDLQKS